MTRQARTHLCSSKSSSPYSPTPVFNAARKIREPKPSEVFFGFPSSHWNSSEAKSSLRQIPHGSTRGQDQRTTSRAPATSLIVCRSLRILDKACVTGLIQARQKDDVTVLVSVSDSKRISASWIKNATCFQTHDNVTWRQ